VLFRVPPEIPVSSAHGLGTVAEPGVGTMYCHHYVALGCMGGGVGV